MYRLFILFFLMVTGPEVWADCPRPDQKTIPIQKFRDLRSGIEPQTFDKREYFRVMAEQTKVVEACLPSYLYQWTSESQVRRVIQRLSSGLARASDRDQPSHFYRSSLGSYPYNSTTWRAQLKDDLNYVYFPLYPRIGSLKDCRMLSGFFDLNRTVFVVEMPYSGYHEYFTCGYGPLQEAQFFNEQHLRLIHQNHATAEAGSPDDIDMIIKRIGGRDIDWDMGVTFDGVKWSRETLRKKVNQVSRSFSASQPRTIAIP